MKILLPLDDSEPSMATLNWAADVFGGHQSEFYILTVVPHPVPELPTMDYEIEDAVELLDTVKALLAKKNVKLAKAEYVVGDPIDSICKYADELSVDQIIVGSHGRTGWKKLLLGSVSAGVFEHANQPVFVYKNVKTKKPVEA